MGPLRLRASSSCSIGSRSWSDSCRRNSAVLTGEAGVRGLIEPLRLVCAKNQRLSRDFCDRLGASLRERTHMAHISMTVNGKARKGNVEPRVLLVHYLREHLRLTGT